MLSSVGRGLALHSLCTSFRRAPVAGVAMVMALASATGCGSDSAPRFGDSPDAGLPVDAAADGALPDASGPDGADAGADQTAPDAASDGSGLDAEADAGAGADLVTFQHVLDGTRAAAEAFVEIANGAGFPMVSGDEWIFAIQADAAGPYRLAGDFNDWSPEPMTLESGVYWVKRPVSSPAGAKYKFVNPSDDYRPDAFARAYGYDQFGQYSLVRGSGAHLERWLQQSDGTVAPRRVRVWVPAEPPVRHLFLQDGQNLFDPGAPFGGWAVQQQLGTATLAVGIDNTPDRFDEYTHVNDQIQGQTVGGQADRYLAFVNGWLRPRIAARYGTPARVGIMGSSLGGLVSLYALVHLPGAFDFVGSLSGTVGWGSLSATNPTLIDLLGAASVQSARIYVDSGGTAGSGCVDSDGDGIDDDGDGFDNYCENQQLIGVLAARGYPNVASDHVPGAPHNEAAWAARVAQPIAVFEAP